MFALCKRPFMSVISTIIKREIYEIYESVVVNIKKKYCSMFSGHVIFLVLLFTNHLFIKSVKQL